MDHYETSAEIHREFMHLLTKLKRLKNKKIMRNLMEGQDLVPIDELEKLRRINDTIIKVMKIVVGEILKDQAN
jgi:hypothetical protein